MLAFLEQMFYTTSANFGKHYISAPDIFLCLLGFCNELLGGDEKCLKKNFVARIVIS